MRQNSVTRRGSCNSGTDDFEENPMGELKDQLHAMHAMQSVSSVKGFCIILKYLTISNYLIFHWIWDENSPIWTSHVKRNPLDYTANCTIAESVRSTNSPNVHQKATRLLTIKILYNVIIK